jgi:ATP adenylyltransferase
VDRLWSPWRHDYITRAASDKSPGACIFCEAQAHPADDAKNFVIHRGDRNFVILNKYPYISGHLMVATSNHIGDFASAPKDVTDEMMELAKKCQAALRDVYRPQGFNIGMNLGEVAGAGIADHIHLHVLPRWAGDTNFMSTVGETRVLPEDLSVTFQKLSGKI